MFVSLLVYVLISLFAHYSIFGCKGTKKLGNMQIFSRKKLKVESQKLKGEGYIFIF